ncbi:MAG TPA: 16S rRNA (guanine(527)-N(7))-methyltransferase RsmG [Kofleriaceae bacterium]|nr:16S rRNA (guanine(527)-N(7))-methyltransferase RsmG [Kofleriaceae bacterium]
MTRGVSRENLSRFVDLFEKWNRSINLSAATTRAEILEHVEDSLQVVPVLDGRRRVLDVGSGGGFPVVVAAICLPQVAFTSLEPIHKKHAFLRTAARELGLANLEPRAERIEDHLVRNYDAAMSRATFDLAEWLATGRQYVAPGGIVIGFEAVPRSDLPPVVRHPYSVAGKDRTLVVFHVEHNESSTAGSD